MSVNISLNKRAGLNFELAVAEIQKRIDPLSKVSHDETIIDRFGTKRQCDIVIRGNFGGRPIFGIIECKDHKRKTGLSTIDAFAKKTENLNSNLNIIVSKSGFTKPALNQAKKENIDCLSLLQSDTNNVEVNIGSTWYAIGGYWSTTKMKILFNSVTSLPNSNEILSAEWKGKKIINWVTKQLLTVHNNIFTKGEHKFEKQFKSSQEIYINNQKYHIDGITYYSQREVIIRKKWLPWSGEGFYDWQSEKFRIPSGGCITSGAINTNFDDWDTLHGDLPITKHTETNPTSSYIYHFKAWDKQLDTEVPELDKL